MAPPIIPTTLVHSLCKNEGQLTCGWVGSIFLEIKWFSATWPGTWIRCAFECVLSLEIWIMGNYHAYFETYPTSLNNMQIYYNNRFSSFLINRRRLSRTHMLAMFWMWSWHWCQWHLVPSNFVNLCPTNFTLKIGCPLAIISMLDDKYSKNQLFS